MFVGPFYWLYKMSDYYTAMELYESETDEFTGLNDYEERKGVTPTSVKGCSKL